jgi:hypothetical protein
MRLPRSLSQSLSVRAVHFLTIGAAIALASMAPVSAGAASPQLGCAPSSLSFGNVAVGHTETLLATVTNVGQTTVTVSAIKANSSQFAPSSLSLPLVLLAGQSVSLSVNFTPAAEGWTSGTVKFSSDGSNDALSFAVAGTGVGSDSVTASPSTLSFGQVGIGTKTTLPVVVKNDRSWNVTLSGLQTTGSGFSISGPKLPFTLGAGRSVTLNVTYAPQSTEMTGGSLLISGPTVTVPLTGKGTAAGQLTIAPAPLNFGDVDVGTAGTKPITMSATGASVTVSSAASSNSQFVLDGATFPLTIDAGHSQSFNVSFTPKASGTSSGSLSFVSNASNSTTRESLTGTGTATKYSVNLMWNSSADAAGYNVYRSTAAKGTFSRVNSTVDPNTAYTDATVVSGQTYYYEATSVSSGGEESARSTPPLEVSVP